MDFIKDILTISGLLFILAGSITIAKSVFIYGILSHHCKDSRNHSKPSLKHRVERYLFNLNEKKLDQMYRADARGEETEIDEPGAPFRGALLMIFGTIIEIIIIIFI